MVLREGCHFPTGAIAIGPERVDADPGLEERGGCRIVGERERVVARTVVAHGGG